MKPTKNDRRIRLQRESLRPLDNASLDRVRGGGTEGVASGSNTAVCDTGDGVGGGGGGRGGGGTPPRAIWE